MLNWNYHLTYTPPDTRAGGVGGGVGVIRLPSGYKGGGNNSRRSSECHLSKFWELPNGDTLSGDNRPRRMGQAPLDLNGTQSYATSEGVSRRTAQRKLKAIKTFSDPAQPALPTLEKYSPYPPTLLAPTIAPLTKPPTPARIDWEEASARAGATEKMISIRLRDALRSGDLVTARVMACAYRDVIGALRTLESESEKMASDRRWRSRTNARSLIDALPEYPPIL